MSGVQTVRVLKGEAGSRLDKWFRRRFPELGHGQLQKLLRTGQVRVDGARVKADFIVEGGMQVRVPPLPDAAARKSPEIASAEDHAAIRDMVVFEDDALLVLNKPAGLAVQGGSKTKRHVDGMVQGFYPGQDAPRLAHRIDRDTSGLLLLGKTPAATAHLARAFQSHRAKKTYWAIVLGAPRPVRGTLKGFLKKGGGAKGREIMVPAQHGEDGAQYALTHYATIESAANRASWIALRPETGRTHQLRYHMGLMGYAIAGDRKYTCDREPLEDLTGPLYLHARSLSLQHPEGHSLTLTAPLAPHMQEAFDLFAWDASSYADPFAELEG